jgi:ankyrin repeat protein
MKCMLIAATLALLAAGAPEMITIISSSEKGTLDVVKHIIEQAEKENMVADTLKSMNEWNMTALGGAAYHGHVEVVKYLLSKGAEVDTRIVDNWTALGWAASNGHVKVCKVLLEAGADVNAECEGEDPGDTPLTSASFEGHTKLLELLVAQPEVNLNAQMRKNGATSLHGACYGDKHEIVEILLLANADPNVLTAVTPATRTHDNMHQIRALTTIPATRTHTNMHHGCAGWGYCSTPSVCWRFVACSGEAVEGWPRGCGCQERCECIHDPLD